MAGPAFRQTGRRKRPARRIRLPRERKGRSPPERTGVWILRGIQRKFSASEWKTPSYRRLFNFRIENPWDSQRGSRKGVPCLRLSAGQNIRGSSLQGEAATLRVFDGSSGKGRLSCRPLPDSGVPEENILFRRPEPLYGRKPWDDTLFDGFVSSLVQKEGRACPAFDEIQAAEHGEAATASFRMSGPRTDVRTAGSGFPVCPWKFPFSIQAGTERYRRCPDLSGIPSLSCF